MDGCRSQNPAYRPAGPPSGAASGRPRRTRARRGPPVGRTALRCLRGSDPALGGLLRGLPQRLLLTMSEHGRTDDAGFVAQLSGEDLRLQIQQRQELLVLLG